MAAILGLDDDVVIGLCADAGQGDVVQAVNFNSPGQVVIAGASAAVDRAIDLATEAGAKRAIRLPVSVPSHCELMKPAAEKLGERLRDIEVSTPRIPVIHNVDASRHADPDEIREALGQQLYKPVLWVDSVRNLAADGLENMVEMGPGKVLMGLSRRIDRSISCVPVQDPEGLDKALDKIKGA
jgi:[acyl-carrier-protein] S-malonyltransferase